MNRDLTSDALLTGRPEVPLLPPGRATPALAVVITVISTLAAIALLAGAMAVRMSGGWLDDLAQTATVQLSPVAAMSADEQSRRTIEVLGKHPGVTSVRPLGNAEIQRLLEPWLGKDAGIEKLPLPQLVAVRLGPDFDQLPELEATLAAIPGARLDSHENTRSQVSRLGRSVETSSLIIVLLVIAALVATIIFATRAGVESHRPIVEVLHLIGASDRFVARQFERHFLRLGLAAGGAGAIIALLIAGLFGLMAPGSGGGAAYLAPRFGLTGSDILLVLAVPVGAALIGWLSARLSVLHMLAGSR